MQSDCESIASFFFFFGSRVGIPFITNIAGLKHFHDVFKFEIGKNI